MELDSHKFYIRQPSCEGLPPKNYIAVVNKELM